MGWLRAPDRLAHAFLTTRATRRPGGSRFVFVAQPAQPPVCCAQGTDMKAAFSCDNGLPAVSIAAYSKGFVVGQDGGVVTIFERDEKEFYRRARAFTIEGNACKVL